MEFASDYKARVRAIRKAYRMIDGGRRWRRISTPVRMQAYAKRRTLRLANLGV